MTPCKYCGYKHPGQEGLCDHCKTEKKHLMEYEFIPGATITMNDVVKSGASSAEIDKFIRHHLPDHYWMEDIKVNQELLDYCSKDCFTDWLIKIGKLKRVEKFQPFTIESPVNSPEEYWEVWHRMNMRALDDMESYRSYQGKSNGTKTHMNFTNKNTDKLWKYVNRYREGPWKQLL